MSDRQNNGLNSDEFEAFQREYQAGKLAFECGRYRESVQHLEVASALVVGYARLNGEAQIWLVMAYEAAEQRQDAIALCKKITHHPQLEIRKQSRRLLYILEAPRLTTHPEWRIEIPDLAALNERDPDRSSASSNRAPAQSPPPQSFRYELEPLNQNQNLSSDNRFIWVALAIAALILGSLAVSG